MEEIEKSATVAPHWWIYRCSQEPHDGIERLPAPPPWRAFSEHAPDDTSRGLTPSSVEVGRVGGRRLGRNLQGMTYQADLEEVNLVNMALHLRRPLLVTGRPGVGKSTLAYSIAHELKLGPVLRWSITSRSTLLDGLYHYDAIGRLQDVGLHRDKVLSGQGGTGESVEPPDIGPYLRLGPLGTALLPWQRPRVLLVDEIDKSDLDLPNDLLNVFEEGEFLIPELARLARDSATVMTTDPGRWVELRHGQVSCTEFPVVVLTSNGERDFPPAFLRRCVRLEIAPPDEDKLAHIVAAHLPTSDEGELVKRRRLIATFLRKQHDESADLANDQLLNALQMASSSLWEEEGGPELIERRLLRPLNED
ncbi:MoxR family ATPase [Streptomyces sp. NBC_01210]|uniref:AAA family ATPase n=1 Tax=Streptomyces sp. NBC_01210 TaxID=2903774 RepID=UPI002E131E6A|nr:MoxR family ATPase [Streptomyces sp. NBC_01210]